MPPQGPEGSTVGAVAQLTSAAGNVPIETAHVVDVRAVDADDIMDDVLAAQAACVGVPPGNKDASPRHIFPPDRP
ncbi:MAG TPA: hypothetical protein VMU36_09315 [Spirochaetia bacterium]|nr:hypothetical protein [Spirochaetia bacterium]